jgi:hypothetical protein
VKEERGGGLLVKSSPPVRCRAAAPCPRTFMRRQLRPPLSARRRPQARRLPRPVALPSPRRSQIGSGGWEVGIETGLEWGRTRPNRARFQSGPPKTNDDSSSDLVANLTTSFRPEYRPFRAGLEQPNEA